MIRVELSNVTKVRSVEDILDARLEHVEILLPRNHPDMLDIVISGGAREVRALARMLNKHANFIDPRRKRK